MQIKKIKVVYATNVMIHYTKNLCEAFINHEAVADFKLIITESLSKEYINLGLCEDSDNNYIIDSRQDKQAAINAINNADLMIGTYYVKDLMKERIKSGKLTFIESERIFKPYHSFLLNLMKNVVRHFKYKAILTKYHYYNKNVRFLLIGRYASEDYIKLGVSKNQILKFGYFTPPQVLRKNYSSDRIIRLLWVGRLVRWKHPEYAVRTCKYLTQKGYKCRASNNRQRH